MILFLIKIIHLSLSSSLLRFSYIRVQSPKSDIKIDSISAFYVQQSYNYYNIITNHTY